MNTCFESKRCKVGKRRLSEAVAIGDDEKDLTRSNHQVTTARERMPTGKELAGLKLSEITYFLRGGCRLNRERSDGLFFEAVWPRLLGRGWSSEQPADKRRGFTNNPLVFLVPGVGKFSRAKHVKGVHYFDSVASVLRRVAEVPDLMVLEGDEEAERGSNEDGDDQQQEQGGPADDGEAPTRKRFRRIMIVGELDKQRGGGIGCSMSTKPGIGPSCEGLARDESNRGSVAVAPDNPRFLFDLNELPKESEYFDLNELPQEGSTSSV